MNAKTPNYLADLYARILCREPTRVECSYWAAHSSAGGTESDIEEELLRTHEFLYELRRRTKAFDRWPVSEDQIERCRDHFRGGGSLGDFSPWLMPLSCPEPVSPFPSRENCD